jgi:hypothetical protein
MAGRQRHELFHVQVLEATGADQDRTNMLLQKGCEGRFEIAIGVGIHNNELQAQRARRRLDVWDDGLGTRTGRVRSSDHAVAGTESDPNVMAASIHLARENVATKLLYRPDKLCRVERLQGIDCFHGLRFHVPFELP